MELLRDPNVWVGLLTLTLLEIVLGIDNIVFISIIAGKLPPEQRERARRVGLLLAMGTRILLLLSIGFIMRATTPLFTIPLIPSHDGHSPGEISLRDLILLVGGLFLIAKATTEIHHKLEGHEEHASVGKVATFGAVIGQILAIDLVFSIDSVITAVGMVRHVEVMVAAVVISVLFMLAYVTPVSNFVDRHPTVKMLALAFLVLIGVNIVAEAFDVHIPKGYTYFAMAFSVLVEMLNLKLRSGRKKDEPPVQLRKRVTAIPSVDPDLSPPPPTG